VPPFGGKRDRVILDLRLVERDSIVLEAATRSTIAPVSFALISAAALSAERRNAPSGSLHNRGARRSRRPSKGGGTPPVRARPREIDVRAAKG